MNDRSPHRCLVVNAATQMYATTVEEDRQNTTYTIEFSMSFIVKALHPNVIWTLSVEYC